MLGVERIPAIVVTASFGEESKVQQFLVENVARLKMRPVDRALLIAHARREGEETRSVAARFGVTATTVRRLESQLRGASRGEVAALHSGEVSLAAHAVLSRNIPAEDRERTLSLLSRTRLRAREFEELLTALGWLSLVSMGKGKRAARMALLTWACETLAALPRGDTRERIGQLAGRLPLTLGELQKRSAVA
jgi:hypothetical protein